MQELIEFGLVGMFLAALLSATLLPLGSELVLSSLLLNGISPALIVVVASLGNTLGSCINYWLGYKGAHLLERRRTTMAEKLVKAQAQYQKYGAWSLLLAWLPIIGDPLTVVAGALKVNFGLFVFLVAMGKTLRYIIVASLVIY